MPVSNKKSAMTCALSLLLLMSCSSNSQRGLKISGTQTSLPPGHMSVSINANVAKFSDSQAFEWFKTSCATCHGAGQRFESNWALPSPVTLSALESNEKIEEVYQSLVHRLYDKLDSPLSPMPKLEEPLSTQGLKDVESAIVWIREKIPAAAKSAESHFKDKYAVGASLLVPKFECKKRISTKQFLNRLMTRVQNRIPTNSDNHAVRQLAKNEQIDAPISLETQKKIVTKFFTEGDDWQIEFEQSLDASGRPTDKGLRKFANRISGANTFKNSDTNFADYKEDTLRDLKQEFFQTLKEQYQTVKFVDILKSDTVKVTKNTHFLYQNCKRPEKMWDDCKLDAQRSNFFGTAGFLLSKPSSFLAGNNNYGRAAAFNIVVSGDTIRPNTDDKGTETPPPIPTCFKGNDFRVQHPDAEPADIQAKLAVATGSMKVPSAAQLCYGCHIGKHLALFSQLFRPFGLQGEVIPKSALTDMSDSNPYKASVDIATQKNRLNARPGALRTPVDRSFLTALADEKPSGCLQSEEGKTVPVESLGDLTKTILQDGKPLLRGLIKHIPRAYGNLDRVNQEIVQRMNDSFESGDGKLVPLFKSFLESESFSCEAE